ncbi:MAG TPA: cytochrome ubiquinol oxidase subunit I [Candidatus Saccharimonadales bacterium]|jgi:cytochrome bd-type quinol oxidase subunit 1|nr:cytochrome ubiquinol oxidase subunit I [Candidatus Saccharimonadales bacterium]
MESALLIHRLQFAFTITFHYLFPQLTMGLAPLIVALKTMALRTGNDIYNHAARFWAKVFGINFILGVVTGIPMEFQFGTNWSHFSRVTGGVIGQPDEERRRIDNPIVVTKVLSFLIYGASTAEVRGLNEFPKSDWPTNIPLLYYSYHIMAGLGTLFIAVMLCAVLLLLRNHLYTARWMLWILLLCLPLPYIANTAGWLTAELGRQPWLVYGLMRTTEGYSKYVSAGNGLFSLLGFMGMYAMLSILFLFLLNREIAHGPGEAAADLHSGAPITVA